MGYKLNSAFEYESDRTGRIGQWIEGEEFVSGTRASKVPRVSKETRISFFIWWKAGLRLHYARKGLTRKFLKQIKKGSKIYILLILIIIYLKIKNI